MLQGGEAATDSASSVATSSDVGRNVFDHDVLRSTSDLQWSMRSFVC